MRVFPKISKIPEFSRRNMSVLIRNDGNIENYYNQSYTTEECATISVKLQITQVVEDVVKRSKLHPSGDLVEDSGDESDEFFIPGDKMSWTQVKALQDNWHLMKLTVKIGSEIEESNFINIKYHVTEVSWLLLRELFQAPCSMMYFMVNGSDVKQWLMSTQMCYMPNWYPFLLTGGHFGGRGSS